VPPHEIDEDRTGARGASVERRAARALKRLARRHPRLAFRLLGVLGRARPEPFGPRWTPDPGEIASRLGISDERTIRRIRREVTSNELRNHALRSLVQARGLRPAIARVRVSGAEHLLEPHRAGVPILAVGWHAGAHSGVPAALLKLGLPVTIPVWGVEHRATPELPIRWMRVESAEARALFLGRALADLADGRIVAMLADATSGTHRHPAPFLGYSHSVAHGVALLARLSKARLVPITTRWVGTTSRVAAEIHPALPEPRADRRDAPRFDAEVAATVAAFFEGWARSHPGALYRPWYQPSHEVAPAAVPIPPAPERRPGQPSP
jgi:lauroyl/myristoyl acyltransferase